MAAALNLHSVLTEGVHVPVVAAPLDRCGNFVHSPRVLWLPEWTRFWSMRHQEIPPYGAMMGSSPEYVLLGDIGATNARLALLAKASLVRSSGSPLPSLVDLPTPSMHF